MKRLIVSIFVLLGSIGTYAQESHKEVCIGFRVGSSALDVNFGGNAASLRDVVSFLHNVQNDPDLELASVSFCGSASPEGGRQLNDRLAARRCANMQRYVRQHVSLPDSVIATVDCPDMWQRLAYYVERSDMPNRDAVLHQLRDTPEYTYNTLGALVDSRKKRLMDMNGGRTWNYMLRELFPSARNASVIMVSVRRKRQPEQTMQPEQPAVAPTPAPQDTATCEPAAPPTPKPCYMAIKTNMLYDALAVPNIGIEFSLGHRWSVAADWMYGWWRHNSNHRYWRIYGGGLSVRKWLGRKAQQKPLQGHHIGLNAQMLTYDFEWGGKGYMGGEPGGTLWDRMNYTIGAEYGYSMPVARRLNIDFSLVAGYMGGRYYEYIPLDGCYVWQATKNRHWVGPTKIEVSLVWLLGRGNYNQKKKGGDR